MALYYIIARFVYYLLKLTIQLGKCHEINKLGFSQSVIALPVIIPEIWCFIQQILTKC